jgi:hypothetical protein
MSNAIELVNMEEKAEQEMAPVIEKAKAFMVTDQLSYEAADIIIAEVRIRVKDREVEFGPSKEATTKAWQAMNALWKKFITDPLEACKTLDRKRYAWKKAEDDRRAREAEALRRAEEKKQADERLALAERMEAAGMKEQANAIIDAPAAPVNVPDPVKVDKPQGQAYVENWQGRVVDPDLVPRELCSPDPVKIGKLAKMMKGKASAPGVVFEDVGSVRRRS